MIKEKKEQLMFNEFQQEIIGASAIAFILVLYFVLKRRSTQKTPTNQAQNNNIPIVITQEKIQVVPEVKEEKKLGSSTNRRKSDTIIPKRSTPANLNITKQNFSEFAGERILVAEDNPINQKVIAGLLAGSGIELVMADDGQEALDILENDTNFLMILMDAHMPRVDGFEATRIIRANPKYDHILVVALSGDIASDDIQKMKDAGMSEQLAKPLRMESLYKIIYAYTSKEANSNENFITASVQNLDVNKGLETCGGDENFYREILSEFMADYGNSFDKLGGFLRAHNIHDADAYLLDIIGVAENIGAHPLGEIASKMKLALSDTHEQSYFSLFDQYKIHLERLKQDITKYL